MKPVLAILQHDGDESVAVCLGCSDLLEKLGLLERAYEVPMFMDPEHSVVVYRFAEGVSLADCQQAVRKRHIGPPAWGERFNSPVWEKTPKERASVLLRVMTKIVNGQR